MAQVDERPLTVAGLAERLARARRDPGFEQALETLQRRGLLGFALLAAGQRVARLERRWP